MGGAPCGSSLFSNTVYKSIDVIGGGEQHAFASIKRRESLSGRVAQPFNLGLVFLLALLQQAQSLTHDFAGVVEFSLI